MLKEELEAIINSDGIWAGRSTLVLAIGILGEYVVLPIFEKTEDVLIRWPGFVIWIRMWLALKFKASLGKSPIAFWIHLKPSSKVLKLMFAAMVVAGIAGEYGFSERIANNANRLQLISDEELASAIQDAGNAIEAAATARKETATIREHSAIVELALRREIDAQEDRIRFQGTRWRLLERSDIFKDPKLKKYQGQVVFVIRCTYLQVQVDNEQLATASILHSHLGRVGWDSHFEYPNPYCGGSGVSLEISRAAPSVIREAANVLSAKLNKILGGPKEWRAWVAERPSDDKYGPLVIVLHVGPHP